MSHLLYSCPHCNRKFYVSTEMVGRNISCSNCGNMVNIPIAGLAEKSNSDLLVIGILSLIVPCLDLPFAIIGLILSVKRKYELGVILSGVGLGISIFQIIIFICVLLGICAEL